MRRRRRDNGELEGRRCSFVGAAILCNRNNNHVHPLLLPKHLVCSVKFSHTYHIFSLQQLFPQETPSYGLTGTDCISISLPIPHDRVARIRCNAHQHLCICSGSYQPRSYCDIHQKEGCRTQPVTECSQRHSFSSPTIVNMLI